MKPSTSQLLLSTAALLPTIYAQAPQVVGTGVDPACHDVVTVIEYPAYFSTVYESVGTIFNFMGGTNSLVINNPPQTVITSTVLTTTVTSTTTATVTANPGVSATLGAGLPSGTVTSIPSTSPFAIAYIVDAVGLSRLSFAGSDGSSIDPEDADAFYLQDGELMTLAGAKLGRNESDTYAAMVATPYDNEVTGDFFFVDGMLRWNSPDRGEATFYDCGGDLFAGFPDAPFENCAEATVGGVAVDALTLEPSSSTSVSGTSSGSMLSRSSTSGSSTSGSSTSGSSTSGSSTSGSSTSSSSSGGMMTTPTSTTMTGTTTGTSTTSDDSGTTTNAPSTTSPTGEPVAECPVENLGDDDFGYSTFCDHLVDPVDDADRLNPEGDTEDTYDDCTLLCDTTEECTGASFFEETQKCYLFAGAHKAPVAASGWIGGFRPGDSADPSDAGSGSTTTSSDAADTTNTTPGAAATTTTKTPGAAGTTTTTTPGAADTTTTTTPGAAGTTTTTTPGAAGTTTTTTPGAAGPTTTSSTTTTTTTAGGPGSEGNAIRLANGNPADNAVNCAGKCPTADSVVENGYIMYANVGLDGLAASPSEIVTPNLQTCIDICSAQADCVSVSRKKEGGVCYLHSDCHTTLSNGAEFDSAERIPESCDAGSTTTTTTTVATAIESTSPGATNSGFTIAVNVPNAVTRRARGVRRARSLSKRDIKYVSFDVTGKSILVDSEDEAAIFTIVDGGLKSGLSFVALDTSVAEPRFILQPTPPAEPVKVAVSDDGTFSVLGVAAFCRNDEVLVAVGEGKACPASYAAVEANAVAASDDPIIVTTTGAVVVPPTTTEGVIAPITTTGGAAPIITTTTTTTTTDAPAGEEPTTTTTTTTTTDDAPAGGEPTTTTTTTTTDDAPAGGGPTTTTTTTTTDDAPAGGEPTTTTTDSTSPTTSTTSTYTPTRHPSTTTTGSTATLCPDTPVGTEVNGFDIYCGYTADAATDAASNALLSQGGVATFEACIALCTGECTGLTYNRDSKFCYTHKGESNPQAAGTGEFDGAVKANAVTGDTTLPATGGPAPPACDTLFGATPSCPTTDIPKSADGNYYLFGGYGLAGADAPGATTAATFAACEERCTATPDCTSFTYQTTGAMNCYLKTTCYDSSTFGGTSTEFSSGVKVPAACK
ncbi:hypothetical protein LTR24_005361 [Lithohypha guttulata]|uniref:Apple domain-containing protein n=1 Tax=Lithohypha guttulata TaxID=1690604 RepID=A0ABR0K914_9EURO|nr:hypothetical protein LTR24_005361 [Lithohypha guttulata]